MLPSGNPRPVINRKRNLSDNSDEEGEGFMDKIIGGIPMISQKKPCSIIQRSKQLMPRDILGDIFSSEQECLPRKNIFVREESPEPINHSLQKEKNALLHSTHQNMQTCTCYHYPAAQR